MTFAERPEGASLKGTNILVRLFPPGLLPAYKALFSPFPRFSAWMNTWVTHYATGWLMGPSKVYDLEINSGNHNERNITTLKQQGLLIDKCTFLETSGCIRTCTYACKIPTQSFFLDYMGLPVNLKPNFTDYSCKFEFGVQPTANIADDDVYTKPCLSICASASKLSKPCLSKFEK